VGPEAGFAPLMRCPVGHVPAVVPDQHRQLRTQMDRFVSRVPVAQGIQRRAQEPISPVLVVPAQASISLFSHLLESRMV
jgi:hypothetical protein